MIGTEAERAGTIRRGARALFALYEYRSRVARERRRGTMNMPSHVYSAARALKITAIGIDAPNTISTDTARMR